MDRWRGILHVCRRGQVIRWKMHQLHDNIRNSWFLDNPKTRTNKISEILIKWSFVTVFKRATRMIPISGFSSTCKITIISNNAMTISPARFVIDSFINQSPPFLLAYLMPVCGCLCLNDGIMYANFPKNIVNVLSQYEK